MFFTLLVITFILALWVSFVVTKIFDKSLSAILARVIQDKISIAWQTYIKFAAYVTGISGGINIYNLERYIKPIGPEQNLDLNLERWILELYRTIIKTCSSLAWMYLVVFLLSLIAFAIVRGFEVKYNKNHTEIRE